MKRPAHNNPRITLSLTRQQLVAVYMTCSELEIVHHEQLQHHFPFHPEQKKNIKMAVRKLTKSRVYRELESALEQAEAKA